MLESLVDVLLPHRAGVLELPEWYGAALFAALAKGAMHKYIKRVPKPGGGYRYFYTVGGGGGVHHADHFVEGASFKHEGGHYHIAKAEGDTVHIRHDESGETKKVSKSELGAMLAKHHDAGLKAHREKAAARLAEAKANKASPKQIARLEAQAKAAGHREEPKSRFGGLSGKAADDFVARHMAASKQRNFERELFEKHRASVPSAHGVKDKTSSGTKDQPKDDSASAAEHHRAEYYKHYDERESTSQAVYPKRVVNAHAAAAAAHAAATKAHRSGDSNAAELSAAARAATKKAVKEHRKVVGEMNYPADVREEVLSALKSKFGDGEMPARKEPKINYRTKVSQSGPKTWDVEIFGPTGKSKHFRVGAPRDIASADEARAAALEEFHASGGPKDVA